MPNTLVVSTFDCPFSEFEAMVKKVDKEQGYVFCSELEIGKLNREKSYGCYSHWAIAMKF